MGRELRDAFGAARGVFEEVDDALGQRLSRIILEGPESDLTLTENAQPALMAVSIATLRVLERECGFKLATQAAFVAGHSLGEYSALAASGVLTLADAARLLKERGRAMQQAVPVGVGAMAALLGAELEQAREIALAAAESEICAVANDNAPGQIVVSGHKEAVERAIKLAAERGIRRAIMLPVSAPFHCPLMQPAADVMARALEAITFRPAALPHVANVTAAPVFEPSRTRALLVEQVTAMVRWRESVLAMSAAGVTSFIELGAGKVLSGLIKRIDREVTSVSIGGPAELEAFARTL
jgi:[acyl-carrier-protein] S-malonyltransferase